MSDEAPLFEGLAEGPANGHASWLTTRDGLRIRAAYWGGDDLKGTVIIFPGRTEYIEKYGRIATQFRNHGLASGAVDWRGQGLSDRTGKTEMQGDVVRFSDYQTDALAYLEFLRASGAPEPFYLLAHSMGGAIGLRALHEDFPVAAACFSAPMWGIKFSPWLRPFVKPTARVARLAGFELAYPFGQSAESYVSAVDFPSNDLTRDRESFDWLRNHLRLRPELKLGGPTYRWLDEAIREAETLAAMPVPDVPAMTFYGEGEEIVSIPRIKAVMENWQNGQLVSYPALRHEILMEGPKMRSDICTEIAEFFQNRGAKQP